MPQLIGGGSFSRGYHSSTCNGVKIGGIIAKKLAFLFHIQSKSHTVRLNERTVFSVKALSLINLKNLSISIKYFTISTIFIFIIYCIDAVIFILWSEFQPGIPFLYYVNVQNLGNGNICSLSFEILHKTKRLLFVCTLGGCLLYFQMRLLGFGFSLLVMNFCWLELVVGTLIQLCLAFSSQENLCRNKPQNIWMIAESKKR